MKKTSVFANGLIWFGAGVSIAEILTGTYFAALGMARGIAAILLGHIIGCVLLFLSGLIGARTERSAMETVKMSFGQTGSLLFSVINVLQLLGWTAIMIYDGAQAVGGIANVGAKVWCLVIGALIVVWILIGLKSLGKVNTAAMALLFALTLVLCKIIFFSGNTNAVTPDDSLSFGAAVELAVAMPLSWLPLISDYTREAEKPLAATAVSAAVYFVISCWMYIIGMGAAMLTGEGNIASILVSAGLGAAGLLIVVFSTVTTTFLDAYSAGVSSVSIKKTLSEKWVAVAVAVLGTVGAMLFPMDDITDFLYLIGSVFVPMIAIQIVDWFVFHEDASKERFVWRNLIVWLIGFALYRCLMNVDLILGSTVPDMVITGVLCFAARKIAGGKK